MNKHTGCQKACGCHQTPNLFDTHKQTHKADKLPFEWRFLNPRYWGIWFAVILVLPLMLLPLRVQFWLGAKIGLLFYYLAKKRVQDTHTNLRLALITYSDQQINDLAKKVFANQGIGLFETLNAWFRPNVFLRTFSISGLHHLVHAQQQNKAVILLGAHFTTLDLIGRLATQFFAVDCVYRKQNNPLLEWLIYNARRHIYDEQIASRDLKKLIQRLKAGKVIWYTPDQDFGLEHGVMATFFGVSCATITAQRRFARFGNKHNPPIFIMIDMIRQTATPSNGRPHYHISLTPVWDYPSDNETIDAQRINDLLEQNIKKDLSQWMWFHRRFKTQVKPTDYYKPKH